MRLRKGLIQYKTERRLIKMKSMLFRSRKQAQAFAKCMNGFIEGPFIDDKLKSEYVVFYKGRRR